jgi:hypothetical protein
MAIDANEDFVQLAEEELLAVVRRSGRIRRINRSVCDHPLDLRPGHPTITSWA